MLSGAFLALAISDLLPRDLYGPFTWFLPVFPSKLSEISWNSCGMYRWIRWSTPLKKGTVCGNSTPGVQPLMQEGKIQGNPNHKNLDNFIFLIVTPWMSTSLMCSTTWWVRQISGLKVHPLCKNETFICMPLFPFTN